MATAIKKGRSLAAQKAGGKKLLAAEFFAGIGLVRLAIERAGWQVVFANDIDPQKQEMYEKNFGGQHFVLEDIHALKPKDIPKCDLFTASFPCNDLSIAGAQNGLNGKESSAFWGLIDILKKSRRPPIVMLENVLGFLQSHGGKDFETALVALNELGYSVDAFILNASSWTPQSRVRLFVVATRSKPSIAGLEVSDVRPAPLVKFIESHPEIDWNVRSLPPLPDSKVELQDVIEDLADDDPQWWSEERATYFFNQFSERHHAKAMGMMKGLFYHYATAFRRVRNGKSMAELRTDGIAGCLRTPRGGSGRQILFKAGQGKYRVRLLTARECARLQGVPDSYVIDVPLNQALFGFGDAVCVPAVEWIARNYLTPVAQRLANENTHR